MRRLAAICLAVAVGAGAAPAQSSKPRVPPHKDPGGTAVALLTTGIDYTDGAIAAGLARDGEGEPIGWDLVDNDPRPFDLGKGEAPASAGGDGTALAHALLPEAGVLRLIAVRVDPRSAPGLGQAILFVGKTPARVVVVPMWSAEPRDWEPFRQAAQRFKNILFIVAAGDGEAPERLYPAALDLENMMTVSAGSAVVEVKGFGGAHRNLTGGALAAAISARSAARILTREPQIDVAQLKRRIMAENAAKP